jgi:DivIVA domain-containing protein
MADDVVRPDEIREVDFRERMRGYHQEDVDAFLERVARGVEVLERQLLEARARVQELEAKLAARPAEGADRSDAETAGIDPDSVIGRTLRIAEEAADAVRREAREEATALREAATQEAQRLVAEARQRAHELEEQARARAAREAEAVRRTSELVRERLAALSERAHGEAGRIEDALAALAQQARETLRSVAASTTELVEAAGEALGRPFEPPEEAEPHRPGESAEGTAMAPQGRVSEDPGAEVSDLELDRDVEDLFGESGTVELPAVDRTHPGGDDLLEFGREGE